MSQSMQCACDLTDRRRALLLLAALGVGGDAVRAQDAARMEPRSYKLLFENEQVRILEYVSRPGLGVCGMGKHSHPNHVTVTLTPAKVKVVGEGGKSEVHEIPAGSAFWEPASVHMAENIGGSGTRMVLVEIKDKDWKPATG